MRATARILITVILIALFTACSSKAAVSNDTPENAVKNFTASQITGDEKQMQELSKLGLSPAVLKNQAEGYYKYKIDEFKFKKIDDTKVEVYPPQEFREPYAYNVESINGKYYVKNLTKTQAQEEKLKQDAVVAKKLEEDAKNKNMEEFTYKLKSQAPKLTGTWSGKITTSPAQGIELTVDDINPSAVSTKIPGVSVVVPVRGKGALFPEPGVAVVRGTQPVSGSFEFEGDALATEDGISIDWKMTKWTQQPPELTLLGFMATEKEFNNKSGTGGLKLDTLEIRGRLIWTGETDPYGPHRGLSFSVKKK